MNVAIRGLGLVGPFGTTPDALPAAAAAPGPREAAGPLRADTSRLEEFVPKRDLRRIDPFSRLALLGAHLALQEAADAVESRDELGVVVATGYGAARTTFGFLDSVIDSGDPCASPTHFSNSVHNAAAAHISIFLKITGPSLTVSQFELSTASGLLTACRWLEEGRVKAVLFGAVDEYCDVLGYCWQRYFGDTPSHPDPLAFDRQSAVPGEGAAFFVLTRDEGGPRRYGSVEGVELGVHRGKPLALPPDALVIVGADGHRRCGAGYRRVVPPGASVVSCAAAFGSTPAGAGFDLAAAALAARPGSASALFPAAPDGPRTVCCLKLGRNRSYGLLTVRGGAS